MEDAEFFAWRERLMKLGRIPQDGEPWGEWTEGDDRRYCDHVKRSYGEYEQRVFDALLDSMQVEEDYEVYETTIGALFAFPPAEFGRYLVKAFPRFLARWPDRAADLLSLMVNNAPEDPRLDAFNDALRDVPLAEREAIDAFICWRCQKKTNNPRNVQAGHKNVSRSKNGNLSDENIACEGMYCNSSAQDDGAPRPGKSCAERGACGPHEELE